MFYDVKFAFHKTDLAVFGDRKTKAEMQTDKTLKIGGERLIFNEKNEHLGLWSILHYAMERLFLCCPGLCSVPVEHRRSSR